MDPLPTATPQQNTTAVVEIPAGTVDGVTITVPAWVGEISLFGVTAGTAFAVIELAARKWLRYSPLLRRLAPGLFKGPWDEYVDAVAHFIKGSDVRFLAAPEEEIKEVLKDPETTAKLLTSGAKLDTANIPAAGRPSAHVVITEESKEEYPNQRLWELLNFSRKRK